MVSDEDRKHTESLFPDLAKIQDSELRKKVVEIWTEAWRDGNYDKLEDIGFWESWRHLYTWSNLDHTNQVTACAIGIAKVAQEMMGMEINLDWLIAGAILHDVDKAVMCDGKTKELTSIGKLLPHTAYSVYLALKHGLPIQIVHMIGTHTAFSVKRQITAEALILHMADYSIADLRNIKEGVDYLWSQQQPCYAELGIIGPQKPAIKDPKQGEFPE